MFDEKLVRQNVLDIISAGIEAVKPARLIKENIQYDGRYLTIAGKVYDMEPVDDIYVIGFGKASATMAYEIENILGDQISEGAVVTSYGSSANCNRIKVFEAGHPIVNEDSLSASKEIVDICKKADKNDFVICLISGGGSALFEQLPNGIRLNDLQELNRLLILCGANINEINNVRKQVSLVKGGKLLNSVFPAKCISLIISDVAGDDIASIASGPLVRDNKKVLDAINILNRYNLLEKIPVVIRDYLLNRLNLDEIFDDEISAYQVDAFLIGNNKKAISSAHNEAERLGYNVYLYDDLVSGEASEAGRKFSEILTDINSSVIPVKKPACVIAGGETTVTVKGNGKGGRNQELALSVLATAPNNINFVFASCGTDGIDGISEAAGGIVSSFMKTNAAAKGIDPAGYLQNNDSFSFLSQLDGVIPGKPTGTNVMDIMVGIVV